MECLVDYMGKRILPLEGELVDVNCSHRKEHLVRVPREVFDKNVRKGFWSYGRYSYGQSKDEFLNREFEDGSYISKMALFIVLGNAMLRLMMISF